MYITSSVENLQKLSINAYKSLLCWHCKSYLEVIYTFKYDNVNLKYKIDWNDLSTWYTCTGSVELNKKKKQTNKTKQNKQTNKQTKKAECQRIFELGVG